MPQDENDPRKSSGYDLVQAAIDIPETQRKLRNSFRQFVGWLTISLAAAVGTTVLELSSQPLDTKVLGGIIGGILGLGGIAASATLASPAHNEALAEGVQEVVRRRYRAPVP